VTETTWIVIALCAGAAGVGFGVWFGGRAPRQELVEHKRRAAKELQEQQARAAEVLKAAQAKAAKDLDDARAQARSDGGAAGAVQRAELEKLTRHLTEAYDELDRLRAKVASGGKPPDTGQGFAATMPLGDL
jgi:flagellar biosynthesis/type III secretory pathway protein FliH